MHALTEGATMLHHQPPPPPTTAGDHLPLTADNFFYARSNPMENAAAAAAAAAAGLIDPRHNRDLHQALVASMANNGVATIGSGLTTAAVLKSAAQQSQAVTQQTQNPGSAVVAGQEQPGPGQELKQDLALIKEESINAGVVAGQNGGQQSGSNNSGSSGRSTPSLTGGSGSDPAPGKLFVGGLSWQTSSDKLKEYFNMFGTVTDVLIMKDPVTQVSSRHPIFPLYCIPWHSHYSP